MKISLVVTTINRPNSVLHSLAHGAVKAGWDFVIIGDKKSPADFSLPGAHYLDLQAQGKLNLEYTRACPTGHYARKNIGYLLAMQNGAEIIVETDDDNFPRAEFFLPRERAQIGNRPIKSGWINVYRYFTEANIWPRGFPLDSILSGNPPLIQSGIPEDCPIQQGLADENPDVDAIYRLVLPLPISFKKCTTLTLGAHQWCPFNSQNTTWWRDVFPLMYLPANCSFRMTDIWRSFVAQRVLWEYKQSVAFHNATVYQERNPHDLMRDFVDELPGYNNNRNIGKTLAELILAKGPHATAKNLKICYEALVGANIFPAAEIGLVEAWLADCSRISTPNK